MLADGGERRCLLDFATSVEAVWSCTTCYACVRVCPVGNEPMMDLLEMRRGLVFDGEAPDELAEVLRSLDEKGNSFGESARKRARWTKKGLDFKIKNAAQAAGRVPVVRRRLRLLRPRSARRSAAPWRDPCAAGVDFGILYEKREVGRQRRPPRRRGGAVRVPRRAERGDARGCEFERIFTTDPHTFNALKNEYGPTAASTSTSSTTRPCSSS